MSVYLRKGSRHFAYDFSFRGKRYCGSTKVSTRREALRYEVLLKRAVRESVDDPSAAGTGRSAGGL
jgi:hypothetical protein